MLNQKKGGEHAHLGGTNPNVSMEEDEEYGEEYDEEEMQQYMDHEEMIKNAYFQQQ